MGRDGLTLIEVIVAMLVLTVGLLALAAGTGFAIRNVEVARVETNRAAAKQSAIESLQATPFDDVTGGSETVGAYQVSWREIGSDSNWKLMEIVVQGPGRVPGGTVQAAVSDTVQYRLVAR